MVRLNSPQKRRAIRSGAESRVIKCVPTGFGFPQSFRPSTVGLYAHGEEDSSPFPLTTDVCFRNSAYLRVKLGNMHHQGKEARRYL